MRNVAETKPVVDTPEAFSQDLYVVCAELAFQVGYRQNPSWAPVRNNVHPSEFVFQKSWLIASDFCGIQTHEGELCFARAQMIDFISSAIFFSCDNFTKNIGNHSQIVRNRSQMSEITAEFGRKSRYYKNFWAFTVPVNMWKIQVLPVLRMFTGP